MTSAYCPCSSLEERVKALCAEAGACATGIARVQTLPPDARQLYADWLAAGRHGEMAYLDRYSDIRANPELLLPGAKSIIVCAFAYADSSTSRHPLFADYALGADYHTVLREHLTPVAQALEKLAEGSSTRICVDTAPLRERFWATRAGVGFIGRNNQLIVPGIGSRVFLAEILWTHPLAPDPSLESRSCDGCDACTRACPGGALDGCGGLDARRCLSYLTIEYRGDLPADLSLPGRIYGCDICHDVCPHNRGNADVPVLPEFRPSEALAALTATDIDTMDQPRFSALFSHSAIKRTKLAGLRRNAAKR